MVNKQICLIIVEHVAWFCFWFCFFSFPDKKCWYICDFFFFFYRIWVFSCVRCPCEITKRSFIQIYSVAQLSFDNCPLSNLGNQVSLRARLHVSLLYQVCGVTKYSCINSVHWRDHLSRQWYLILFYRWELSLQFFNWEKLFYIVLLCKGFLWE